MDDFKRKLAVGQIGESLISKWLQSRGHSVFPAYQIEAGSGKGPQLFSENDDLVLPDLLAFNNGKIMWFEAKHKTCFTWHRLTKRWTTGIDLRHYGEYKEVAIKTKIPVWLLFYHPKEAPNYGDLQHGCPPTCPTGLFGGDISFLSANENHRSKPLNVSRSGHVGHGKSGMVYWSAEKLRRLAGNLNQQCAVTA